MTITLPLPARELSPNWRGHWATKARAVQRYRMHAWAVARATAPGPLGPMPEWVRATAHTTFYLPDRRRRDRDNLMASLKACWDGLVDARVLADDAGLIQMPPVLAVDRDRPRVEITLEAA